MSGAYIHGTGLRYHKNPFVRDCCITIQICVCKKKGALSVPFVLSPFWVNGINSDDVREA